MIVFRQLLPLVLSLVLFLPSCKWKATSDTGETVLARVHDKILTYRELIEREVVNGLDADDSARVVNNYIQRWVKDQLLLNRAEFNLTDRQKQFERQIEDYRRDLLIFSYQQAFLKENLDTSISEDELSSFYNENREQFLLKENIFKVDYAVFPRNTPRFTKVEKLFFSDDEKDKQDFKEQALQYARLFSLSDTIWYSFQELNRIMPVIEDNESDFISRKRRMKFEDDNNVYLIRLREAKMKESPSPLRYAESTIRSILLNKRKLQVLEALEDKLFKDGIKKNNVEIFN
jgi:hypothetical protein